MDWKMSNPFNLCRPDDDDSLGDQTTNDSINIKEIEAIADELDEIVKCLDGPWRVG